jgi:two-component system sensor histidine kinase/response regulator
MAENDSRRQAARRRQMEGELQQRAQEALRASESRYRTLYNSSRDAIMMLSPGDKFLSGNPAAVRLFACRDEDQFTSCQPADLSPEYQADGELSAEKAQHMMAIAMAKGSHSFEWLHRRIDGGEFVATVLLTRMELEGKGLLQATVRDITEEKRTAEALQAAKEAAENANRAKSDFLASMSHEIRTPLNAVIGLTELVLDTPLSNSQRDYLKMVQESGELLLGVINDILDFSKIEAGKLDLECAPFDLRAALGSTLKPLALRAHSKGLELACQIDPGVPDRLLGDVGRLRQVVVNLVGNAIKFTDTGEVVLGVQCQSETDTDVVLHFVVTDTGIGIPAEKQATIFAAFEQADPSLTRRHRGTGLGLAISTRLVKLMNGRIWLESQSGAGSMFHFTAQLGRVAGELAAATAAPRVTVPEMKVLVVDDNATSGQILRALLGNRNLQPEVAAGAQEALRVLREARDAGRPFPLVVADANMPDMDGFALAEQVQRDRKLDSRVIMLLSSGDLPTDIARCGQLRVSAYLLKPVVEAELYAAVATAMGMAPPDAEDVEVPLAEPLVEFRSLRILLAEDSIVNQKLTVALLERQGHTVVVANDGRQATAALQKRNFDLVLMDVEMPQMDGFEATTAIRAMERQGGGHIPIIAMTAHAMKGDRQRCLAAGMDAYISKPIRIQDVLDTIAAVVGSGHQAAASSAESPPPSPPPQGEEDSSWLAASGALPDDQPLLKIVIETYLQESPRMMEAIRQAVADGDVAALRLAAHTLKGSIRFFGAGPAFQTARRLERMGREGKLQAAPQAWAALEREIEELIPQLENYLQQAIAPDDP